MNGKVVTAALAVIVCVCAYFINPQITSSVVNKLCTFFLKLDNVNNSTSPIKVFSKEELTKFNGKDERSIYLALVGNVYDVTKGRKHYGPGGGYEFFAGIDGSKAYVTGQFNKEGLIDDISDLSPAEILALDNWKSFYERDYKFIGRVEGVFYDLNGVELPMLDVYRKKLKVALLEKELLENDNRLFPPCNSEWNQANGGRVWCTTQSGGISREWVGVPRMYYVAGSSKPRCACVRTTGPPSNDPEDKNKDRGDLDNPNLSIYPNCNDMSVSCPVPQ